MLKPLQKLCLFPRLDRAFFASHNFGLDLTVLDILFSFTECIPPTEIEIYNRTIGDCLDLSPFKFRLPVFRWSKKAVGVEMAKTPFFIYLPTIGVQQRIIEA